MKSNNLKFFLFPFLPFIFVVAVVIAFAETVLEDRE